MKIEEHMLKQDAGAMLNLWLLKQGSKVEINIENYYVVL